MHTQMIILKAAFRNKDDFLVITDNPQTFSVLLPVQRGSRFSYRQSLFVVVVSENIALPFFILP